MAEVGHHQDGDPELAAALTNVFLGSLIAWVLVRYSFPGKRLVDSLVAQQDWSERTRTGAVFGRWEMLVGPEIAAHCAPQTLTEGELLIVAESTAWATQLRLLAPTILAKLHASVGGDVVTRLRVVGPTAPSWKKGPRSVRGRGPRDTYG